MVFCLDIWMLGIGTVYISGHELYPWRVQVIEL